MENIKKLLVCAMIIITQCGWTWGWQAVEAPTAIYYPGVVATTNVTLSSQQTGNTIVFNNSTGVAANNTLYTLPAATVGLDYAFVSDTSNWFAIRPNGTDIINLASAVAGQRVSNSATAAVGDSISVICVTAGQWSVYGRNGTWAAGPGAK